MKNSRNELPVQVNNLVELHVSDFKIVKNYYKKMGFNIIWERPPEGFKGYLVIQLENNILCFWAGNEAVWQQEYFKQYPKSSKRGYGVELVLMVKNIDSYYEYVKNRVAIFEELTLRPWGLKDFRIEDVSGFYLRFTSLHNILDPKYAVK